MERKHFVHSLAKEDLISHLEELKQQIETRLVGQKLADLNIHYTQDHSQDFRSDDLDGNIDLGAFVHDAILSTDIIFDSITAALNNRICELQRECATTTKFPSKK